LEYHSKLIEAAVNEIAKLPGIGKKTALRLALHLIKENENTTFSLTDSLNKLKSNIQFCKVCHGISDDEICMICSSSKRDRSLLCVVEESNDVMAIENTSQFSGVYHVLGGIISPIKSIGPAELKISSLLDRVSTQESEIKEIILALSPTLEGDTTSFYLHRKLKEFPIKISSISRGIAVGSDLEYADEITLGRSITARTEFK